MSNFHPLNEFLFACDCAAKAIETRYVSNRTEHTKLRKKVQHAKSGQKAFPRMTARQKFKLERYSFLDPFSKKVEEEIRQGDVIGKVSICMIHFLSHEG